MSAERGQGRGGGGLVLSLFPGIGLLDMAFEEEGFCVVRGPDLLWGGDIRRFHPPARRFDGVIGGPPCQKFSGLGNLARARGTVHLDLIPEFERVVREAEPYWFLMENVAQAPLPVVRGYEVDAQILNNRWMGGTQNRVRRFSFGSRYGVTAWLHLEAVALEPVEWKHAVTAAHAGARKTHIPKYGDGAIARYSVSEAAETQGLPADFLDGAPFTQAGKLKAIANGVPLPMGRAVARAVRASLRGRS